jgi:rfaE bifunctional protein nucleotidyltransferase chain/domain
MDLLHSGHIRALVAAKEHGDVLVVLMNSDVSVKTYKGPYRPIVDEHDRAVAVAALECVDYVVLFDEPNPKNLLGIVRPDVYCNNPEWGEDCIERGIVEKYGGIVKIIPRTPGISTSDIIERLHAIERKGETKAVFFDRDGTLNVNGEGYVHRKEDFTFFPGVFRSLKRLKKAGFKLFVVTNQSGIGRGYYTAKDVQRLHVWMKQIFARKGVVIDKIYFCPHITEDDCTCRKPGYGLLLQAVAEYKINLSKSWIVGDSWSDTAAGREVNLKTIQIGKSTDAASQTIAPHFWVKDLNTAVDTIVASS